MYEFAPRPRLVPVKNPFAGGTTAPGVRFVKSRK
jgi:hypothetical protein